MRRTEPQEPAPVLGEIEMYLNGRFLCSMDAMFRILGFKTYPATTPTVRVIKVKTMEQIQFLLEKGLTCDMLLYYNRQVTLFLSRSLLLLL
jgi:hypothetical protein